MANKFIYITPKQYREIGQLFEAKDPENKLVLRTYGEFSDIAVYSEKYDTMVFTTLHSNQLGDSMILPSNKSR